MAARRGPLGQLANIAAARDGVVTRTFGTSLLYSQWTSGVVEGASRWHGDDYRAYCGGALQATKAIHQAISGAASDATDPDLEDFLTEHVKVGVGQHTREAIAELLGGTCDILLEPTPGVAWTELNGFVVSRHRPELVDVAGLARSEVRVITGKAAGYAIAVDPGTGVLLIEPKAVEPGQASPIVIETVESRNELAGLLGGPGLDAALVRFDYDRVHVFGAGPSGGAEHVVRALQMGTDVPAFEAQAVIEAQQRLFVQRRHGVIPQETIAGVVGQVRLALSDLVGAGRGGRRGGPGRIQS